MGLTLYSIIMLLTPLNYHVMENMMENGAFAPIQQMLLLHYIFKSIQNFTEFFKIFV